VTTKNVLVALASVIGADGKVEPAEMKELLRAAEHEGLSEADLRAVEAASAKPLDPATLDHDERLFVYAIAYWLSRVDGEMSESEDKVITKIGKELGLADGERMGAEGLVDEIAATAGNDRPERFDIAQLRKTIGPRLRT
jgi:uncharacterized tellurite resistance protein B-like protein